MYLSRIKNAVIPFAIFALFSGAVAAEEPRLGFVNTARILKEAPQAETARKKLEFEFAPRDKKIVAMQKKLKAMEDQLVKDAVVMSDAARKKLERQIISDKRDVKRSKEEFTEDLNIRRNEELNKLQKLVYDTIVALANEQKYDLILGDSVLFASKRIDVTDQVLIKLKDSK